MKNHTKYPALVSTILLTTALLATPAQAEIDTFNDRETSTAELDIVAAPATATLTFERTAVTTQPAPFVPEPIYAQATAETVSDRRVASSTPTNQTLSPKAAPAPVSASGKGAAIAAAAYAQLGVSQDCTALATNSLSAVGINFHGWPAEYLALGTVVPASEAQAGDLAYYANGGMGVAHIAVYVGNGMAVHGGWNGGTTALFSANVGSGPVFIRVA